MKSPSTLFKILATSKLYDLLAASQTSLPLDKLIFLRLLAQNCQYEVTGNRLCRFRLRMSFTVHNHREVRVFSSLSIALLNPRPGMLKCLIHTEASIMFLKRFTDSGHKPNRGLTMAD